MKSYRKLREDGAMGAGAVGGGAANVTGSPSSSVMSMPSFPLKRKNGQDITIRRRMKTVDATSECFNKFSSGKIKFQNFLEMLDVKDPEQRSLREYFSSNPDAGVILRDATSGAVRTIQRR